MKIMEIRLVLTPLLGALTLALGIAVAETNNDSRSLDDATSKTVASETEESRVPVVWEEDIPDLELASDPLFATTADETDDETATPSSAGDGI